MKVVQIIQNMLVTQEFILNIKAAHMSGHENMVIFDVYTKISFLNAVRIGVLFNVIIRLICVDKFFLVK